MTRRAPPPWAPSRVRRRWKCCPRCPTPTLPSPPWVSTAACRCGPAPRCRALSDVCLPSPVLGLLQCLHAAAGHHARCPAAGRAAPRGGVCPVPRGQAGPPRGRSPRPARGRRAARRLMNFTAVYYNFLTDSLPRATNTPTCRAANTTPATPQHTCSVHTQRRALLVGAAAVAAACPAPEAVPRCRCASVPRYMQ